MLARITAAVRRHPAPLFLALVVTVVFAPVLFAGEVLYLRDVQSYFVDSGCTGCHGLPPPAPHATLATCSSCHLNIDDSFEFIDPEMHIDGNVDVF